MKKMELSLASDYVPGWTIVDAVRELFQNALDQEVQCPDNTASWEYSDGTLLIRNKKSTLTTKSLLLGSTTKADDAGTIGQFGEGYKVATLVLLRNGLTVTFYNYGAREVWRPRFVKSRRFGAEVLTFFIESEYPWSKVPTDDLVVEIQGITDEEYNDRIVPSNLHLRNDFEIVESNEFGDIINVPGAVYVNGLFVCKYDPYKYGYNFKPGQLRLDRDRKLASDWDLKWLASKMWCNSPKMLDLVEAGAADTAFVADMAHVYLKPMRDTGTAALERFKEQHGAQAVPVSCQSESESIPVGYKAVIVPEVFKRIIKSSPSYVEPEVKYERATALDKLRDWYSDYGSELSEDADSELQAIVKEFENEANGNPSEW